MTPSFFFDIRKKYIHYYGKRDKSGRIIYPLIWEGLARIVQWFRIPGNGRRTFDVS